MMRSRNTKLLAKQKGLTLIEMIAFIVILAVVVAGIFGPLNHVLNNAPKTLQQMRALNLATSRMELMLNLKRHQGFAAVTTANDPCQPPLVCNVTGYQVEVSVTDGWIGDLNNPAYKTIRVQVSGAGSATLETLISR